MTRVHLNLPAPLKSWRHQHMHQAVMLVHPVTIDWHHVIIELYVISVLHGKLCIGLILYVPAPYSQGLHDPIPGKR